MAKVNVNEQDNSIYRDQQFISISYNGNTNNIRGSTPPQPYELPIASATTLGGIKVGNNLNITADGTLNAVGGSGGGAQPDWNQSDSAAPDYIKNRPFYEEIGGETTVEFGEGEFEFDPDSPNEIMLAKIQFSYDIPEGAELKFVVNNGETSEITKVGNVKYASIEGLNIMAIGNLSLMGIGEDTGEDYLLFLTKAYLEFGLYGQYTQADSISDVTTLEISFKDVAIYPIDKKFIPKLDGYIEKSPSVTENNPNIAVGERVYVDKNSCKNIIASNNITVVDYFNSDNHNVGTYIITSTTDGVIIDKYDGVSGNIELSDQNNTFIGTPYQTEIDGGKLIDIEDTVINIDTVYSGFTENDDIKYMAISKNIFELGYFADLNYHIEVQYHGEHSVSITGFIPKDPQEAAISRRIDPESNSSKFNSLIQYMIEEVSRFYSEQGDYAYLTIAVFSELYSVGGQGSVIIGNNVGAGYNFTGCVVLGNNILLRDNHGSSYPYSMVVIGNDCVAHGDYSIAIGDTCESNDKGIAIGYHAYVDSSGSSQTPRLAIGYHAECNNLYRVNIADNILVDHRGRQYIFHSNSTSDPDTELVLYSSNGTPYGIYVDNDGTLKTRSVSINPWEKSST